MLPAQRLERVAPAPPCGVFHRVCLRVGGGLRPPVALALLATIGLMSSVLANTPVVAAALVTTKAYLVAVQAVPEVALADNFTAWPALALPLFVGMMFGGTLGGNATLIGASANMVSAGICAAEGERVTFMRFMRLGLPIALAQLAVGALYVVLVLPRLVR